MTEPTALRTVTEDEIAEPWRRLAGFVIDWTILVFMALIVLSMFQFDLAFGDDLRLPPEVRIVQGLVAGAYYIGFTTYRGQTPGKMLVGTRVLVEQSSRTPGPGVSVLRWFVPGVFVFLPGLSVTFVVIYGWLLFDGRRRGLHDKVAKTVVVRSR